MGFFSSKSREEEVATTQKREEVQVSKAPEVNRDNIKIPTLNVSILRDTFKVKATIEGKGSLIIGSSFDGDVTIEDTFFLEKGAKFNGTVHAKNIKVSGDFVGTIYSTVTEITNSGTFSGNINTNKTFLGGKVDGVIRSIDSIEITSSGVVDSSECKSKQIKVEGKVKGKVVASELLEVTSGGSVEGDIITKGIRTEQGGTIIGNIQTYDASVHEEELDFNRNEDISKIMNIKPDDMKKYARKEKDRSIKRVPADKK